jgi:CheY-like chemotaxis protein
MSCDKVFIIDDEEDNLACLTEIITKEGLEVQAFSSGSDALAKMQTEVPAMIFLDIQMPGMNGFEVLKAIRQVDALLKVPVVFLSAISSVTGESYDPDTIQSKYGVRPDAFVPKLIEPDTIKQQLKKFIKDKPAEIH